MLSAARMHTISCSIFFFNDTATTEIYTLSLHDALPILRSRDDGYDAARAVFNGMIDRRPELIVRCTGVADVMAAVNFARDRKSTRLNSSHANISYAVFCLKKKNIKRNSVLLYECDAVLI